MVGIYHSNDLVEARLKPHQLAAWVITGSPYFRGQLPSEVVGLKDRIARAISIAIEMGWAEEENPGDRCGPGAICWDEQNGECKFRAVCKEYNPMA